MTVEAWIRDGRLALRSLVRRPGFAAIGVLTLALGIGANTAIFSVIYGSLLRPLPYDRPDELVWLGEWYKDWPTGGASLNRANYLDLKNGSTRIPEMAAYEIESSNFSGSDWPARIRGARIEPGFFPTLGVVPRFGRGFTRDDNHRDAPPTAVLTDGLWQELFGGDTDVVGRTVTVNAEPHTVIGVLPAGFTFMGDPRFFKPFRWDGIEPPRGGRNINAVGRLAPGVPLRTAWDELTAIYARLEADYPEENDNWTVWVEALGERALGASRRSLLLLGGAVGLVLLIACVNVANLLLVRAETRQRELAVRFALGSGRGGLLPTFLSESLLIAVAGGLVGILAARWGVDLLVSLYGASLARADQIALNPPALAFGLGLAMLTGLVVGLAPVARTDGSRLQEHLREGSRASTDRGNRLKRALVVVEMAMAVLLVSGSGLLIHSFWRISHVDTGLEEPESVLTFRTSLSTARHPDRASQTAFYADLQERLRQLPGSEVVGLINRTPLNGGTNITAVYRKDDPNLASHFVEHRWVTRDLFEAIGVPLLAGRLWTDGELQDTAITKVVINETMARQLFPEGNAPGGWVDARFDDEGFGVIGVVADTREMGHAREAPPSMYLPYPGRWGPSGLLVAVRAASDPMALAPSVRQIVRELDPDLPVYSVRLLSDAIGQRLDRRRFSMSLLAVFAGLALLLGGTGIYGVISFSVAQRTREMGVRLALGASRRSVRRLVLGQALGLALPGVLVGLAASLAAGRVLGSLLFEVKVADPLTYIGVALALTAVCAAASLVPALRATRVDPVTSLRAE
jgi:predicted permease